MISEDTTAQPLAFQSGIGKLVHWRWPLILFVLSLSLYANTLGHGYTQDDAIVIYDNMYTQKGFAGFPGILSKDTFFGFFKEEGKSKLVSGGRYRPFTLLMFAIEWQFFGKSPFVGHLINVLLFGLLSVMIYKFLLLCFRKKKSLLIQLSIILTALLFVCHPVHTEAVANIKGRDEIMTMLASIFSLWALLKYTDLKKPKYLLYMIVGYFVALLSKENAITMLAIAPVSLMLFRSATIADSIKKCLPLFGVALIFVLIRFSVLGMDFGSTSNELMNNPFLKFENGRFIPLDFSEKYATIFFSLGKYILLMLFPVSLCHDYYPRAIEIMGFGDWQVIISIIAYLLLAYIAFKYFRKFKLLSFGILFYLFSLSIVSNIVFPIGTNMSERFLFMPSLGFLLALSYLMVKYIPKTYLLLPLSSLILLAFSFKTISRNMVWKDDYTLFTSDVNQNTRSAKLLNAAGGALSTSASTMAEGPEKTAKLIAANDYLERAIKIHPLYRNAFLLLGNTNYYLKRYNVAVEYYDKALEISPDYKDVLTNLPIVLRDGAKHKGQIERDFDTAETWLLRSYQLDAKDFETCRLLGVTYGVKGDHRKAIQYFAEALKLKPDSAVLHAALGTAYRNIGDIENARIYLNKAVEIDPNALNHLNSK